ncbi:DUF6153 family protein [Microbacterium esteraromaticum]|jgi:hypothetical protein|uniref:DUF6153 family protein n=1 Tax=Microbacterium esteraromaticum TaxID=57043 RepID=UPI00195BFF1D|nr:DUF6153 family protein [Microbacterium esteraromaticum]MBM7465264.1 microcystin-dependent protein [Microbacterium esteraromaticum]
MRIAVRATPRQLSLRSVLMLGAAAVLIIVGLLAMHTFTAESAGHGSTGVHVASTVTVGHDLSSMSSASADSSTCDPSCDGPAGQTQRHADVMAACVLALLAGLLLLIPPVALRCRSFAPGQVMARLVCGATVTLPRAPSLIFLSISRT